MAVQTTSFTLHCADLEVVSVGNRRNTFQEKASVGVRQGRVLEAVSVGYQWHTVLKAASVGDRDETVLKAASIGDRVLEVASIGNRYDHEPSLTRSWGLSQAHPKPKVKASDLSLSSAAALGYHKDPLE